MTRGQKRNFRKKQKKRRGKVAQQTSEGTSPLVKTAGHRKRSGETTTAGGCPAVSGATHMLSAMRAPGWFRYLF